MLRIFKENFTNQSLEILENKIYEHIDREEDFLIIFPNRDIVDVLSKKILNRLGVIGNLKIATFEELLNQHHLHQDIGKYFMNILLRKSVENLQQKKKSRTREPLSIRGLSCYLQTNTISHKKFS